MDSAQAFSERYTSEVDLQRPERLTTRALDSRIFSRLESTWEFRPSGEGTDVSFKVEFEVANSLTDRAIATFFEDISRQQLQAFRERCSQLVTNTEVSSADTIARVLRANGVTSGASADELARFSSAIRELGERGYPGCGALGQDAELCAAVHLALDLDHRHTGRSSERSLAEDLYILVRLLALWRCVGRLTFGARAGDATGGGHTGRASAPPVSQA